MAEVAARVYVPTIYTVRRRRDLFDFLCETVEASGGRILYASEPDQAPVYLEIQDLATDEQLGVLCHLFRCNSPPIKGRAADEHRVQIRYGDVNDRGWREQDHPIGREMASADILGANGK